MVARPAFDSAVAWEVFRQWTAWTMLRHLGETRYGHPWRRSPGVATLKVRGDWRTPFAGDRDGLELMVPVQAATMVLNEREPGLGGQHRGFVRGDRARRSPRKKVRPRMVIASSSHEEMIRLGYQVRPFGCRGS